MGEARDVHLPIVVARAVATLAESSPCASFISKDGDHVFATAIVDHLLHHSHVLTIFGDSFPLREKRRAGLIKATPTPAQAGTAE